MISRYAEISRVTIHKHYKSKEALFRAVIENHIANSSNQFTHYTDSTGDFWAETEAFIIARCGGLFKEITSSLIRTDLLHAGQSYCQDIIQNNEVKARDSINFRITKEIDAKRLTLENIDMTAEAFARAIHSAPFGLALSSLGENHTQYVNQLIKVFKASSSTDTAK